MTIATVLTFVASCIGAIGGIVAIIQIIVSTRTRRADASQTETETDVLDRKTWMIEAHESYGELKEKYEACCKEIVSLRQEVGELKDALIGRVEEFDETLPYVQGLPDDKMREIRASNRAVKMAVYRGTR